MALKKLHVLVVSFAHHISGASTRVGHFFLYNFFFSPPAHLSAVTHMTEISLIVTLNTPIQLNSNSVIDVTAQMDWRWSWTYGRTPNAIDIS